MKNCIIIMLCLIVFELMGCYPEMQGSFFSESLCNYGWMPWQWGLKDVGSLQDDDAPFIALNSSELNEKYGECQAGQKDITNIYEAYFNQVITTANPTTTPSSKVAIFSMGVPGVGKSSSLQKLLTEQGFSENNFVHIDPDNIRGKIAQFQWATQIESINCKGKKRAFTGAASWCYQAGWDVTYRIFDDTLASGKNFIQDTPCKDAAWCLQQMDKAISAGYTVFLYGVWAPQELSAERVLKRAYETGRWFMPSISEYYTQMEEGKKYASLMSKALETGGTAYIFDNSGSEPKVIFKSSQFETEPCPKEESACKFFFSLADGEGA